MVSLIHQNTLGKIGINIVTICNEQVKEDTEALYYHPLSCEK